MPFTGRPIRELSLTAFSLLAVLGLLSACSPPAVPAANGTGQLTVLAAASLADSFQEIGRAYQAAHPGIRVSFSFAGSQLLRSQIEQGAAADVFASADSKNMDSLKTENLLAAAPRVFAHNLLTVIAPQSNPASVKQLKDLARPGLKLILADPGVPVGNYTLQVLNKLSADPAYGSDFKARVLANVVSHETDVKAVVGKIALDEGDAGVVYGTDARAPGNKLSTIAIPDQYNVVASYPIAVLKSGAGPSLAQQFVDFVLSSDGQAILNKYGFAPR